VNLPVEFDASRRARECLMASGVVSPQEAPVIARVLRAAALTYVAATLTGILTLLYYLLRLGLLGRRSNNLVEAQTSNSTKPRGPSMKITRIVAYRVELPLLEKSYRWSGGKSVEVFDSTIVRVETDAGLIGHGEVCPLGPAYLPAHSEGVRAGLQELGPRLIGEDPTQLERLNRLMDASLKGHPHVKSGIDIACWDILGQAAGLPVCVLLGGRYGDDFALYRAISQGSPEAMAENVAGHRAEGYRKFQLKVGGDPAVDIARI